MCRGGQLSPVGQLGEQQVRGGASSPQPGEAAQDREPRQAGDGGQREAAPDQEPDQDQDDDRGQKDGGREGGQQDGEHVCCEEDRETGEALGSLDFNQSQGGALERSEVEACCPLRRRKRP